MPHDELTQEMINLDFEPIPSVIRVAGVAVGGKQDVVAQLKVGERLVLKRDYYNEYDKNAVGVYRQDKTQIGWIPRNLAAVIAPEFDAGFKWIASVVDLVGGGEVFRGVRIKISWVS